MKHIKTEGRSLENKTRLTIKGHRYRVGNPQHPYYKLYKLKGFEAVYEAMGILTYKAHILGEKVKSLYNQNVQGHVYIISNPAWEGWFKVGMAVDAKDRCSSYQTSSPFRDYKVSYSKYFEDRREAERLAHSALKENKIKHANEWFKTDLKTIKNVIKNIKDVHHEA